MKMQLAVVLHEDATVQPLTYTPENFLALVRGAVGGYVEHIPFSATRSMWVNEDGKRLQLPINRVATRMFRTRFPLVEDFILGPVVLTGGVDGRGRVRGLASTSLHGPAMNTWTQRN